VEPTRYLPSKPEQRAGWRPRHPDAGNKRVAANTKMPAGALAPAEVMPKLDGRSLPAEEGVPAAGSRDDHHRGQHAPGSNIVACLGGRANEPNRRPVSSRGLGHAGQGEPTLATGPVSPAPAAPRHPPALVDAHLVWERQLAKLDSIDLRLVDEPVLGAVCDQIDQVEDLILGTPARTLEGAMIQVRRVAASLAHNDGDAREQRGLRLALATLARLRGA
jgi:hypothetical protein